MKKKKEGRIKSFAFPRFVFIGCWLILREKETGKKNYIRYFFCFKK